MLKGRTRLGFVETVQPVPLQNDPVLPALDPTLEKVFEICFRGRSYLLRSCKKDKMSMLDFPNNRDGK